MQWFKAMSHIVLCVTGVMAIVLWPIVRWSLALVVVYGCFDCTLGNHLRGGALALGAWLLLVVIMIVLDRIYENSRRS